MSIVFTPFSFPIFIATTPYYLFSFSIVLTLYKAWVIITFIIEILIIFMITINYFILITCFFFANKCSCLWRCFSHNYVLWFALYLRLVLISYLFFFFIVILILLFFVLIFVKKFLFWKFLKIIIPVMLIIEQLYFLFLLLLLY